jgi:hypothetical protein
MGSLLPGWDERSPGIAPKGELPVSYALECEQDRRQMVVSAQQQYIVCASLDHLKFLTGFKIAFRLQAPQPAAVSMQYMS